MFQKKVITLAVCLLLILFPACNREQTQLNAEVNQAEKQDDKIESSPEVKENKTAEAIKDQDIKAEVFADSGGKVGAGIIFDSNGNMFAARDGQLDKIAPDGKVATFCSFKDLPEGYNYYFTSPLIWDMTFDNKGNILAAAQDRILKITPEGKVTTIIREDFEGFLGASGIECDKQGNIYITNGSRIDKYTPDLKKSAFIDNIKNNVSYGSFFSLEFDPAYKNLYVSDFNSKSLLKYEIDSKGKAAVNPVVVVERPLKTVGGFGAPLNIAFSEKGNMYVSIDGMSTILKVDTGGAVEYLKLGGTVTNHCIAFGGKGFDEESLYITTFDGKGVYKYKVGEKAAKR